MSIYSTIFNAKPTNDTMDLRDLRKATRKQEKKEPSPVVKVLQQIAGNEEIFAVRIAHLDSTVTELRNQLKEIQTTIEDIKRFTSNIGK